MTRISLVSDLHLEFDKKKPFVPEFYGEDVLVMAGDIQVGLDKEAWFSDLLENRDVVYVMGNHEYYNNDFTQLNNYLPMFTDRVNLLAERKGNKFKLYSLQDSSVVLHDIKFFGGALWTDFKKNDPIVRITAIQGMSDYKVIRNGNRKLNVDDVYESNQKTIQYIETELAVPTNYKKFVVTHHLPSYQSVADMYRNPRDELFNNMYYSNFDTVVEKADFWVHGHTHESCDYTIGNCKVVCNPRGYNAPGHLNKNFKQVIIDA